MQDKERKERDYLSLIKELKEEKERHKIKHQQLEGVKNDYEAVVSQRELTIREIQQELKKAD